METKVSVMRYNQNGQSYISLVMPLDLLESVSQVLVYDQDSDGYQRKPNKIHYNKIKKYALENRDKFVLPTSIILGADKSYIESRLELKDGKFILNVERGQKKFRVVDGQHRIYGLKEAAKEDPTINAFPVNVIVILTDEDRRSVELEVFTDINSKAKRINTDLAELAKYDYQIKEKRISENEINRHIGIKTAYYLKQKNNLNVWQNAIKFDIHAEVSIGIVGISIFTDSIKQIIDRHIQDHSYKRDGVILEGQLLIDYCNNASELVGNFLYRVWNEIIKIKWGGTFKEDIVKNDEGLLVKIFYSTDYYIQKGIGVKSLNPIIGMKAVEKGINDNALDEIKEVFFDSKVKIEHWKNGGPFSGFNSESGFNKIKQMILNELPVDLVEK